MDMQHETENISQKIKVFWDVTLYRTSSSAFMVRVKQSKRVAWAAGL
jgi:hypothetical protein